MDKIGQIEDDNPKFQIDNHVQETLNFTVQKIENNVEQPAIYIDHAIKEENIDYNECHVEMKDILNIDPASVEIREPLTFFSGVGTNFASGVLTDICTQQHNKLCGKQLSDRKDVISDMDAMTLAYIRDNQTMSVPQRQDIIAANPDSGCQMTTDDDIPIKHEPLPDISEICRSFDDDGPTASLPSSHTTQENSRNRIESPKTCKVTLPVGRHPTRKRKLNPENWKKNVNKKLRQSGKEYTDTKGYVRKAKAVQAVDCSKCKFKCTQYISEEKRHEIFGEFYALNSYDRQKDFICANTNEKSTITILGEDGKPVSKIRSSARSFSFCVDDCRTKVCKTFFSKTLAVSISYIEHALHNRDQSSGSDKRGRHSPANKTCAAQRQKVRRHIESFHALSPYYPGRNSNRKYLDQRLNITKMYSLYTKECKGKDTKPVTHGIYRKIFLEDFDLSFHRPKKDQCQVCSTYNKELTDKGAVDDDLKQEYEDHQTRIVEAGEEKERDIQRSKSMDNLNVASFAVQPVLSTPCSNKSKEDFTRNLSSYGLTVCSLSDGQGCSYIWDETEGKQGSSEISTCLYLYLSSLKPTVDTVTLYSIKRSGENRDKHTAAALNHAVTFIPNIKVINHKFLETGHAQMECDSMHSNIEHTKKRITVNVPEQWHVAIQLASRIKPYEVIPLTHNNFLDFKNVSKSKFQKAHLDSCGNEVKWQQIRWLQFRKDEPYTIYFRYSLADDEFKEMKVPKLEHSKNLERLYEDKLPISEVKKRDLLSLCTSNFVPVVYHEYYNKLETDTGCRDCLPEPDEQEDDTDTDTDD